MSRHVSIFLNFLLIATCLCASAVLVFALTATSAPNPSGSYGSGTYGGGVFNVGATTSTTTSTRTSTTMDPAMTSTLVMNTQTTVANTTTPYMGIANQPSATNIASTSSTTVVDDEAPMPMQPSVTGDTTTTSTTDVKGSRKESTPDDIDASPNKIAIDLGPIHFLVSRQGLVVVASVVLIVVGAFALGIRRRSHKERK